jgi:hypothetical protein
MPNLLEKYLLVARRPIRQNSQMTQKVRLSSALHLNQQLNAQFATDTLTPKNPSHMTIYNRSVMVG